MDANSRGGPYLTSVSRNSAAQLGVPSLDRLGRFMCCIDRLRATLPPAEWSRVCHADSAVADWRAFLIQDPYTRHALQKPRGYPGDASLMDFAYGHPAVDSAILGATDTGRAIYRLTSTEPLSISARRRMDFVAHLIRSAAAKRPAISVTSFASGHAREIESLTAEDLACIEVLRAVDSDQRSLAEIESCYGRVLPVRTVARTALRIRPGYLGESDLVYAAGLFDYLDARHARRVLGIMASCVRPGGRLLIGNLADDASNLGYCEAIMDWWMVPRSRAQMLELGATLDGREWSCREIRVGCFRYLVADRMAQNAAAATADLRISVAAMDEVFR